MSPGTATSVAALAAVAALLALGCGDDESPAADASAPDAPDSGVATMVPAETADEAALLALADWRALPSFGPGHHVLQSSRETGAGPPVPDVLFAGGNRDMNHFYCASAGAEATAPQLFPFVFAEATCPESYVQGFVIARFEGTGRLVRLWKTTGTLPGGEDDGRELLRIYVDDEQQPLVQVPTRALADGSAGEIFAPPFGAGLASFVAWYYPVVFSKRLVVTVDRLSSLSLFFHQVDVVLDPAPGARQRASARLAARDTAAATLASAANGPLAGLAALHPLTEVTLAPSATTTVATLAGPATVHTLRVQVPEANVDALADVDVAVTWDGAATPSIDLSLAELFAILDAAPPEPSLALAATRAGGLAIFQLRLPMPFATGAVWTLHNRGGVAVTLSLGLEGESGAIGPGPGRLHVVRSETVGPTSATHHPVVTVDGPGRLAGVCLMLEGHALSDAGTFASGYNFLEGDERITIDGTSTLEGTGTEDYLDSAFYFREGAFGTPFAQAWAMALDPTASPPAGRVSACRWHVLGAGVDFATSLAFDLEIGPAQPALLDRYRSVAFVYLPLP